MARKIELESVDGKKKWRAKVTVAPLFNLPYVKLQWRNCFGFWETFNSQMPFDPDGEATVEELVDYAIKELTNKAKRAFVQTEQLYDFVYGGDGK